MKATQLYRKHNGASSEVNGRVSAAERTLTLSSLLSGRRTARTPSIMLSGVLCSKMCTEFRSWVWKISKTVRTCWASLDQQLINKAIDQCDRD